MKSTTGAEPTASVMAVLVSAERKRRVMELVAEGRGKRVKAEGEGRAAWRRAWGGLAFVSSSGFWGVGREGGGVPIGRWGGRRMSWLFVVFRW